ncbi:MAG: NAD(P)/FAD-dependent oxidoreductase [Planctomycetota bacterium]
MRLGYDESGVPLIATPHPFTHDAIVVGAGPAGASLALRLARAGRHVALLDGASFPRGKVCGEGVLPLGVAALAELEVLEAVAPRGQAFGGVRYWLPDGTSAAGSFPDGLRGLGISRAILDAALVAAAERARGVDLRLGAWVQDLERDARGVTVRIGGEALRAPLVVGADGGRSRVRRAAGLEARAPRRERFGVGVHVDHPPRTDALPRVEVLLAPGAELYLTPLGPTTTGVAVLLERAALLRLQGRLDDGVRDLLRAAGGPAVALAERPFLAKARALGPLGLGARAAHTERVALVGDAAGALDPISGEGIALGLCSARLLAEELDGCFRRGDFSTEALAGWTRRRQALLRAPKALTATLLYLARRPRRARRAIQALAKRPERFDRLLGVAAGATPVGAGVVGDGLRLALGF